jgi:hypothetical protein
LASDLPQDVATNGSPEGGLESRLELAVPGEGRKPEIIGKFLKLEVVAENVGDLVRVG